MLRIWTASSVSYFAPRWLTASRPVRTGAVVTSPAHVVVEAGQQPQYRARQPPHQRRRKRRERDHRDDGNHPGRQVRPGKAGEAVDEQDMRTEAEDDDRKPDVKDVAVDQGEHRRLAVRRAQPHMAHKPARGRHRSRRRSGPWDRAVLRPRQEKQRSDPPQDAEQEDGECVFERGPARKIQKAHDPFSPEAEALRLRASKALAAPTTAPAAAAPPMIAAFPPVHEERGL